jgi:eukaryotic-like serine/threonine-protein kinase
MDWADGLFLHEMLENGVRFSPWEVVQVGIGLARAIGYLHDRRIVHRNIKPGNIILSKTKGPILTGFTVALSTNHDGATLPDGSYGYIGTPQYSAPEQLMKPPGPVKESADLFALGLVLYEMLTHQFPFKIGNDPKLYADERLPKPERSGIPELLYEPICLLLSEDPNRRLSAMQLQKTLEICLEQMG